MMTKSLKSTDVGETHDISFEAPFTLTLAGHIDMLFFRCFVCNRWFLFIVRVNVVFLPSHSLAQGWEPAGQMRSAQTFYMARIRILVTQFRVQDCVKNKHRDKQLLRQ